MTLELVRGDEQVLDLQTFELMNVAEATDHELVRTRAELTRLAGDRAAACAVIDAEIVRRADNAIRNAPTQRTWTFAPYTVSVSAPDLREVDPGLLRAELMRLAAERRLPSQAFVDHLFRETISYRLDRLRWKVATGVPEHKDLLETAYERCSHPAKRTVRVTEAQRPAAVEATVEQTA